MSIKFSGITYPGINGNANANFGLGIEADGEVDQSAVNSSLGALGTQQLLNAYLTAVGYTHTGGFTYVPVPGGAGVTVNQGSVVDIPVALIPASVVGVTVGQANITFGGGSSTDPTIINGQIYQYGGYPTITFLSGLTQITNAFTVQGLVDIESGATLDFTGGATNTSFKYSNGALGLSGDRAPASTYNNGATGAPTFNALTVNPGSTVTLQSGSTITADNSSDPSHSSVIHIASTKGTENTSTVEIGAATVNGDVVIDSIGTNLNLTGGILTINDNSVVTYTGTVNFTGKNNGQNGFVSQGNGAFVLSGVASTYTNGIAGIGSGYSNQISTLTTPTGGITLGTMYIGYNPFYSSGVGSQDIAGNTFGGVINLNGAVKETGTIHIGGSYGTASYDTTLYGTENISLSGNIHLNSGAVVTQSAGDGIAIENAYGAFTSDANTTFGDLTVTDGTATLAGGNVYDDLVVGGTGATRSTSDTTKGGATFTQNGSGNKITNATFNDSSTNTLNGVNVSGTLTQNDSAVTSLTSTGGASNVVATVNETGGTLNFASTSVTGDVNVTGGLLNVPDNTSSIVNLTTTDGTVNLGAASYTGTNTVSGPQVSGLLHVGGGTVNIGYNSNINQLLSDSANSVVNINGNFKTGVSTSGNGTANNVEQIQNGTLNFKADSSGNGLVVDPAFNVTGGLVNIVGGTSLTNGLTASSTAGVSTTINLNTAISSGGAANNQDIKGNIVATDGTIVNVPANTQFEDVAASGTNTSVNVTGGNVVIGDNLQASAGAQIHIASLATDATTQTILLASYLSDPTSVNAEGVHSKDDTNRITIGNGGGLLVEKNAVIDQAVANNGVITLNDGDLVTKQITVNGSAGGLGELDINGTVYAPSVTVSGTPTTAGFLGATNGALIGNVTLDGATAALQDGFTFGAASGKGIKGVTDGLLAENNAQINGENNLTFNAPVVLNTGARADLGTGAHFVSTVSADNGFLTTKSGSVFDGLVTGANGSAITIGDSTGGGTFNAGLTIDTQSSVYLRSDQSSFGSFTGNPPTTTSIVNGNVSVTNGSGLYVGSATDATLGGSTTFTGSSITVSGGSTLEIAADSTLSNANAKVTVDGGLMRIDANLYSTGGGRSQSIDVQNGGNLVINDKTSVNAPINVHENGIVDINFTSNDAGANATINLITNQSKSTPSQAGIVRVNGVNLKDAVINTLITGFGQNTSGFLGALDISDVAMSSITSAVFNGGKITVSYKGTDGNAYTLTFNNITTGTGGLNIPADTELTLADDGNGGTYIEICFLPGVRLAMEDGLTAVEDIRSGQRIWATGRDGVRRLVDVVWTGSSRVENASATRSWPVRIKASAIAEGVPSADVLVTPEHSIYVDGKLIPSRMLVNGRTIIEDRSIESYDYYHVETAQHSLIEAEGLPTESYLDTGNRSRFAQKGSVVPLRGRALSWGDDSVMDLSVAREDVEPVWQALNARAKALGVDSNATAVELVEDAGLHLLTESGYRVEALRRVGNSVFFMLPAHTKSVRLVSRSMRLSEVVGPYVDDRRELGVLVGHVRLWSGETVQDIDIASLPSALGWHDAQPTELGRWTNGKAHLSVKQNQVVNLGAQLLEVEVLAAGPYLKEDATQELKDVTAATA